MDAADSKLLLGRHTPVVQTYAPQLLYAISRATARQQLGIRQAPPFHGVDLWHAYEMSWLDDSGKPVVRVGRFAVPADSPNIVESKSFKLYLNSLNSKRFAGDDEARQVIVADISATAGRPVTLELFPVDDAALSGARLAGACLDGEPLAPWSGEPCAGQLQVQAGRAVEEKVYSHLLRSLCPVTGQPDWATVWLHYRGLPVSRGSLLQYIVAYRQHQEFHEQCVERMFCDITAVCEPEFLHIQAFYTRRGGLDINPFRSTQAGASALPRLDRQ